MAKLKIIRLPCFGILLNLAPNGAGGISSDLDRCDGVDAIESLVLAHACAGFDVQDPTYIEGIETAVQALFNNMPDGREDRDEEGAD